MARPPADPDGLAWPGPYDAAPQEEDLWFLPGPDEEGDKDPHPALPPLPRSGGRLLFDLSEWRKAEAAQAQALAGVAVLFGALDERLRRAPDGWRHRLALTEAVELSWWIGDRISNDRLALWSALRLSGAQEDPLALSRAGWALRRLGGGPGPESGPETGPEAGLAAFLGRASGNEAPPEAVADLADLSARLAGLHPFTRAAALFQAWRLLGEGEAAHQIEAAVLAARSAAAPGRGGALFLPLAAAGFPAARATGSVGDRLARWLEGAEAATLAALLELDRLQAWQDRATRAIADLSGRTPALLVAALTAWPMLTAPMAEKLTGASRASVQRNLDLLCRRGLAREITGQGRYRIWTALT